MPLNLHRYDPDDDLRKRVGKAIDTLGAIHRARHNNAPDITGLPIHNNERNSEAGKVARMKKFKAAIKAAMKLGLVIMAMSGCGQFRYLLPQPCRAEQMIPDGSGGYYVYPDPCRR